MPRCAESSGPSRNPSAFRRQLLRWYRAAGRHDLPWRATRDPYAILVSEFMLQQTQVATVLPYYERWLQRFPDFASVARASENDVLHAWQGLGYYSRPRNLQSAAREVVARWQGKLPNDPAKIAELPGVGLYTANAIASFAFDRPVPIAEANIARLLARLHNFGAPIDTASGRAALWRFATHLLSVRAVHRHNSALMDLGALVCTARNPKCSLCPVRQFCAAEDPASLPVKTPRRATVRLLERHRFQLARGRVLLAQAAQRWRGMWILPELIEAPSDRAALYRAQFPFTHHQITLAVFAATDSSLGQTERWFPLAELPGIPMPSPHRRALTHLLRAHPSAC